MQEQETITISVTLLVWIMGILLGAVAGLFTLCGHLLLSIFKGMSKLVKEVEVSREHMEGRLLVVERHDRKNEEQRDTLLTFLSSQKGKS